jgi:hypothetical protein
MQPAQVDHFRAHGYVRLAGFHARKRLAPVRQQLLDELKRLRIWAAGKSLSSAWKGMPAFQQINKLSSAVKVPGLQQALMTPEVLTEVAELAGLAGRAPSANQGTQLLLSLPRQGAWTLQGLNWHVDVRADPPQKLPGIQAFVLIDDVVPHGGATLILAGSHHVGALPDQHVQTLRDTLKTSTDLPADLRALGIEIVEMSGSAGDVFLMDMRVLHTPSVNASNHLRMMATSRFLC